MNQVALQIAHGQSTDLTDPATLIGAAGLSQAAASAVTDILTATQTALDVQLAGITAPLSIFIDITGASIVLQGDAATALAGAAQADTDASYTAADNLKLQMEVMDLSRRILLRD